MEQHEGNERKTLVRVWRCAPFGTYLDKGGLCIVYFCLLFSICLSISWFFVLVGSYWILTYRTVIVVPLGSKQWGYLYQMPFLSTSSTQCPWKRPSPNTRNPLSLLLTI